jgi:outer membrane protein
MLSDLRFKTPLLAVLLLINTLAFAQTEKGNIMSGASIDMGSTFVAATKYTNSYFNLSIAPGLQYFVINNLAVGGSLNFSMNVYRREKITSFLSEVGPSVRYYFGKKKKPQHKGFAQVSGGYATSTFINDGKTSNRDGFYAGALVGFAYFINKSISLETSLGFNYNQQKDVKQTNIPFRVGFNIFILPKSKKPLVIAP